MQHWPRFETHEDVNEVGYPGLVFTGESAKQYLEGLLWVMMTIRLGSKNEHLNVLMR